MLSRVVS